MIKIISASHGYSVRINCVGGYVWMSSNSIVEHIQHVFEHMKMECPTFSVCPALVERYYRNEEWVESNFKFSVSKKLTDQELEVFGEYHQWLVKVHDMMRDLLYFPRYSALIMLIQEECQDDIILLDTAMWNIAKVGDWFNKDAVDWYREITSDNDKDTELVKQYKDILRRAKTCIEPNQNGGEILWGATMILEKFINWVIPDELDGKYDNLLQSEYNRIGAEIDF